MEYSLEEVAEIPTPRVNKASPTLYKTIMDHFRESGFAMAKVKVPGRNPDVVARRLDIRGGLNIAAVTRGTAVYLLNRALVSRDE
jgi:hypothetical protein